MELERICYEFMVHVVKEQQELRLQYVNMEDSDSVNSLRYYQLVLKNLCRHAYFEELQVLGNTSGILPDEIETDMSQEGDNDDVSPSKSSPVAKSAFISKFL